MIDVASIAQVFLGYAGNSGNFLLLEFVLSLAVVLFRSVGTFECPFFAGECFLLFIADLNSGLSCVFRSRVGTSTVAAIESSIRFISS